MSNSIIVKCLWENILVTDVKARSATKTTTATAATTISSAQAAATIVACRVMFASSVSAYLFIKINEEKLLLNANCSGGGRWCCPLFPDGSVVHGTDCFGNKTDNTSNNSNKKKYHTIVDLYFKYGFSTWALGLNAEDVRRAKELHNLSPHGDKLSMVLLHCCPTVQKFTPIVALGGSLLHRDYTFGVHPNARSMYPASDISSLTFCDFITKTCGGYLKTLVVDQVISEGANEFGNLFSTDNAYLKRTGRHPVPLLEKIVMLNMDGQMLLEMCDKNDGKFSPAPSLEQISFKFNDDQQPMDCVDCGRILLDVIKSYAEYPHSATIRNNLKTIEFNVSCVSDPYDCVAPQDAASVVIGCAKYLPHCLRSLSVSADTRFTSSEMFRSPELISAFGQFEVLNTLEIFCDHEDFEENEPNELWSDDPDNTKLVLPRSLTELHICYPVIDARCIADALQAQPMPFLQSFRYKHCLNHGANNHENMMSLIFGPIASSLRCLELKFCFRESCGYYNAYNTESARYCDFNADFCDPNKPSSYLLNTLEEFSFSTCSCCYSRATSISQQLSIEEILEKEESAAFMQGEGGNFFPLLASKSLKKLSIRCLTNGALVRRLLAGDKEPDQSSASSSSSSKFDFLDLVALSPNPRLLNRLAAELGELATKTPRLVQSWKRISLNTVAYCQAPSGTDKFIDLSNEMLDFLDVIALFPSIEAFEFCGTVKNIFKSKSNIKTREDLEEVLKNKGGLDKRLRYLDLGTYS